MEPFFSELAKGESMPQREEFQRLFRAHGMEMIGPPLTVE
jgi:hypothetical protein